MGSIFIGSMLTMDRCLGSRSQFCYEFDTLFLVSKVIRLRPGLFLEVQMDRTRGNRRMPPIAVLGDALLNFFNKAKIIFNVEGVDVNIMDFFPLLKSGYAKRIALAWLMNLYVEFNLSRGHITNNVLPDDLFVESFDGVIPALFYIPPQSKQLDNPIPMQYAIEKRMISRPMNTFEVLAGRYGRFSANGFPDEFLRQCVSLNTYEPNNMTEEIVAAISEPQVIVGMEAEYILLHSLLDVDPGKHIHLTSNTEDLILEIFLQIPQISAGRNDLFLEAIRRGKPFLVSIFLADNQIDPRDKDHLAFRLAKEKSESQVKISQLLYANAETKNNEGTFPQHAFVRDDFLNVVKNADVDGTISMLMKGCDPRIYEYKIIKVSDDLISSRQAIIEMLEDAIVKRNLLEKEMFKKNLPYQGADIFRHLTSLR